MAEIKKYEFQNSNFQTPIVKGSVSKFNREEFKDLKFKIQDPKSGNQDPNQFIH
jgi:hypothetical protein